MSADVKPGKWWLSHGCRNKTLRLGSSGKNYQSSAWRKRKMINNEAGRERCVMIKWMKKDFPDVLGNLDEGYTQEMKTQRRRWRYRLSQRMFKALPKHFSFFVHLSHDKVTILNCLGLIFGQTNNSCFCRHFQIHINLSI